MYMGHEKEINEVLSKELKRYSSSISHVSFTGEFVFIFFRQFPKRNVEQIKDNIMEHLYDQTGLTFKFMKSENKQWVFKVGR